MWLLLFRDKLLHLGLPGGTSGKEPACQCRRYRRRGFNPEAGKIPWRRAWQLTPVFLPGEWQKGVWQATVHRFENKRTWLKRLSTYMHARYVLFWISYVIFVVLSFTSTRPIFLSFYLPGFLQFFFFILMESGAVYPVFSGHSTMLPHTPELTNLRYTTSCHTPQDSSPPSAFKGSRALLHLTCGGFCFGLVWCIHFLAAMGLHCSTQAQ